MTNQPTKSPIAVIGLGLLGTALCERLMGDGYPVVVYNRTRDKAAPLIERGARWSDNPLAECERAVICLYTTGVVEEVLGQMDAGVRAGQTYIDATTGNPDETRGLGERLAERGVEYLESPIVASSEQTRRGEAMALVAGRERAFAACRDLFACIAPNAHYVGAWGSAAKAKLVNNLILGLNRAALAEGLWFAQTIGLDPARTLAVLREGNAYARVMDVKGDKMVAGDFTTQARLAQHAKDVRIILEQAAANGVRLPFSELHSEVLRRGEEIGLGDLDNSAVIRALAHVSSQLTSPANS